ncbi:biogenesis of lysosome-related organelles complex 1 subunit 4-like [Mercenaria mercenaria]|uniref:biogenesis of lysosome-related organelles complex 1 subunit 4-like n=1 Tax=Mercenaria mercenaria TaxID=6596 RepID=UPI00234FA57C|nr:biogenesis of lysosome-related organelles complex 1 subunit 4-like [Mercenaria mercenaria]
MLDNPQTEEENLQVLQTDLYELTKDYGQYLQVDASKERQAFYNSIEEMLTKLDEFGGLVDTIRSDTSLCVDKNVREIQAKCADMKQIFTRIDQLEAFVQIVREDVNSMEECVNKAENEMGSFSSFRKMFSSLVGGKKSGQNKEERTEFVAPEIFVTEQYLHPASNTQQIDPEVPEVDKSQDIPDPVMPEVDKSQDIPNVKPPADT